MQFAMNFLFYLIIFLCLFKNKCDENFHGDLTEHGKGVRFHAFWDWYFGVE